MRNIALYSELDGKTEVSHLIMNDYKKIITILLIFMLCSGCAVVTTADTIASTVTDTASSIFHYSTCAFTAAECFD